ncbi:YczE/YyaS/YitT family protein [Enterococcus bulliens]
MKKKLIWSLFYYILSAFGISLTIKAFIGVSSFNSLNVTLSTFSSIKVGTITTMINLSFFILCILLDKKRTLSSYLTMLVTVLLFGTVINLFVYGILAPLTITAYLPRVLLFSIGTLIGGYGTGRALGIGTLKFPIEQFCLLLADKTKRTFSFYRYSIDIVCIALSLLLSIVYQLPIAVREGTIISLFLLSFMISFAKDLPTPLVFRPKKRLEN